MSRTRLEPALRRDVTAGVLIALALAGAAFGDGPVRFALLGFGLALGAYVPFGGLLAIALSVFTLPLMEMPAVVSDVRPDELLLLAITIGTGVRAVMRRDWKPGAVERAFSVFLVLSVASVGVKYALGYDVAVRAVAMPLVRQALHLVLFTVAVYLLAPQAARSRALAIAGTLGALLAAALGIVQYHSAVVHDWVVATYPTLDGKTTYPYVPGGLGFRSMSAFDGNPNHFGVAMVVMAVFCVVMATRAATARGRWLWAGSSLVMLTAVLFTTSRTAFLAAAGLLLLVAFLGRSRTATLVGAAWMAIMTVVPNEMPERVRDLFGTRTETGVVLDPSVTGRVEMMTDGVGGTTQVLPIHDNFYLDQFHNYGALALAGFGWLAWVVGSRLFAMTRAERSGPGYAQAALLAWLALAAVSFTGGFFATQRVAEVVWLLVALAFASDVTDSGMVKSA